MPKKKKHFKQEPKEKNEWPVVVYIWAIGLSAASYVVVEIATHDTWPHPIHWLVGLAGGVIGIPIGWLWYRWKGDVF